MPKKIDDKEIFYGIKKIQDIYRVPMKEVKERLVEQKICYFENKKIVPYQIYIDRGDVIAVVSEMDGNIYYKFRKDLILSLFVKNNDKISTPMTYNEAAKNLYSFRNKLKKFTGDDVSLEYPHIFIPGFEREFENYLFHLKEHLMKFSKKDIVAISINITMLSQSKRSPYKLPKGI